jgi:hypothetical protein
VKYVLRATRTSGNGAYHSDEWISVGQLNTNGAPGHDGGVTGTAPHHRGREPERQSDTLEDLRSSVRVTLRARRWLNQWRVTSAGPWGNAESTAMIANAIELSALTEFVVIQREATQRDRERPGDGD